jgi:hypothetical protein
MAVNYRPPIEKPLHRLGGWKEIDCFCKSKILGLVASSTMYSELLQSSGNLLVIYSEYMAI